jgi:mRNA interferase MazF
MNESDVVLTPIPQADGQIKNRPAVILRKLPPYEDFLVCGVSTQLQQYIPNFDEFLSCQELDFAASGLMKDSIIRLGFLAVLPQSAVRGSIGSISIERHRRMLQRLSQYLVEELK